MRAKSPKIIALITAMITAGGSLVFLSLFHYYFHKTLFVPEVLIGGLIIFFISWITFYYALQRFIYKKIKLIFRNMHSLKVERDAFQFNMSKDVIGEVNQKVVDWAEDRMAEIKDLREKENFRKEFVGNVAHELKTPVFSIQGYILTLLEGALEDPNFNRKFLLKAAKSVERMTLLIEDLDTITNFESGNLKLNIEKIDIVDLCREIIDNQEDAAAKKQIKLKFNHTYERPIYVLADSFRISQVLTNLIGNSINYGKEGGTTLIKFFDMEDNIMIEVDDNGPGISAEHLPRLFERFYRVDRSRARHHGGTGLGLAIVKHILEAHKQSISVRSETGKGSVFSFTLKKAHN